MAKTSGTGAIYLSRASHLADCRRSQALTCLHDAGLKAAIPVERARSSIITVASSDPLLPKKSMGVMGNEQQVQPKVEPPNTSLRGLLGQMRLHYNCHRPKKGIISKITLFSDSRSL